MEKDLETNHDFDQSAVASQNNLSTFAYDSVKRTLYCATENNSPLKSLEEDQNFDDIVTLKTGFSTGKSKKEEAKSSNPKTKSQLQVGDIEEDEEVSKRHYVNPETLRFSRTLSSQEISPSGLTATCTSSDTDKFWNYLSNVTMKSGIYYWEVICPISCSGIEFGIKNKETNETICATFRTTTSRVVGMQLDLTSQTLKFWLNGRQQEKRNQSFSKGEYYLLIKMKNLGNTVILNPFAQLNEETMYLPNCLLLTKEERNWMLTTHNAKQILHTGISKTEESPIPKGKPTTPKKSGKSKDGKSDTDDVPDEGSAQKIKYSDEFQSKSVLSVDKLEDTDSGFDQNYARLLNIYESVKQDKNIDDAPALSSLKWSSIDYTDKVLTVGETELKVLTRDSDGKLDLSATLMMTLRNSGSNHLVLSKQDMLWLLTQTNWKQAMKYFISSDERDWISQFIEACETLKSYRLNGSITIVIEIEIIVAKIVIDTLMRSASDTFNSIRSIFTKIKNDAIMKNTAGTIDNIKTPKDWEESYFFNQNISVIKILQLISVLLWLQEQTWLASKKESNEIDPSILETLTSRTQTAYGRLSSYISWPNSQIHPIKLSEAGLINTWDQQIALNHFQEYGIPIEEDILKSCINEGNSLTHYLQTRFPNNLMIKGYPSINLPLHKTINLHPAQSHTSNVGSSEVGGPDNYMPTIISQVCVPKYSRFLLSANCDDGSVCLWNSELQLFQVGRLDFKKVTKGEMAKWNQVIEKVELLNEEIVELDGGEKKERVMKKYEGIGFDQDVEEGVQFGADEEGKKIEDIEESKEVDQSKDSEEVPLVEESEASLPPKIETPEKPIIPDPKYLADLMNMGFTKEESSAALISVKNESIELALDKVFEQKNQVVEEQEADLQNVIQQSMTKLQNQSQNDGNNEADIKKQEEEAKNEQLKKQLEENTKLKNQKVEELNNLQKELDQFTDKEKELRKCQIHGFSMVTSFEPSQDPIVASCVLTKNEKVYVNVKNVSYYQNYLEKFIKKEKDVEISTLDLHEVATKVEGEEDVGQKQSWIDHVLTHCEFSINTLFPIFVGHQVKKNWTVEQNTGPAMIFGESNNREVEIPALKKVYGVVTLKDFYTKSSNAFIGILGQGEKPCIVPVEIHPNKITVHDAIVLDLPQEEQFDAKWENGYVMLRYLDKLVVYKINNSDVKSSFTVPIQTVKLNSADCDISCIDVMSHAEKSTQANISQLACTIDSPIKQEQLQKLMNPTDSEHCKILIKDESGVVVLDLLDKIEEVSTESGRKERTYSGTEEIKLSSPLIDRKMLKNAEEFDVYESLIQGKTLDKPAFLIDSTNQENQEGNKMILEVDFEKPLSLFWLGIELYFDSKSSNLLKSKHSSKEQEESKVEHPIEPESAGIISENLMKFDEPKMVSNVEFEKSDNNCIPLVVYTHKGCAFNATSQLSKLVSDDKRSFGANYADSQFIFSHQFGKKFIINQYIVMSENSSQIGAFPMGSGMIFIGDTITELENTKPFHHFNLKQYLEWKNKRVHDPRPLQSYEPVGYFDMGTSVKIMDKIASKSSCKYVKLVPTGFKKTANNSFPQEKFTTYPIEFKFFGIIGEELDSRLDNEENSEIATANPAIQSLCDTHSTMKIEILNKETNEWEAIYDDKSSLVIKEIQTLGTSFNISSGSIDKVLESMGDSTITGVHKDSITNSRMQMNMVQKLRLVIENTQEGQETWKIWGAKIWPKVLLNIEKHSKGVFSNIPVKYLRSCILDPEYFDAINKQIVLALTDDDIDFNIRLRAIRTLNLIISLNPKMVPLIFQNLDLEKFISLLFTQDSRGCRYITGLFRKFYETEELNTQISDAVIENVSRIHQISMTHSSLESFMSLITYQMLNNKEKVFRTIFETLYYKISKESISKLHTPEYTLLRKLVDSELYPFDTSSFNTFGEGSSGKESVKENSVERFKKQSSPLPYMSEYRSGLKSMEFDIDLGHQSLVKEIRLLFAQTNNKAYRFSVRVYAKNDVSETMLFCNTYDESYYCYLTQNCYLKEYKLYDESEEREALSIGHLNYLCRYLKIQISFFDTFLTLNGKHSIVENIFPEVYGEFRPAQNEEAGLMINEENIQKTNTIVGHSSPFNIITKTDGSTSKYLQCCPTELALNLKEEKKADPNNEAIEQNTKELSDLRTKLSHLLWKCNNTPKTKRAEMYEEIKGIESSIEAIKTLIPIQSTNESNEIVPSLEYQMCLATKFSQLLYSIYISDSELFAEVLKDYDLQEIIYDLFELYIIRDSQKADMEKPNIHSNEVWKLINNVLLPSLKDQSAIDSLVIKILNNFILKTDRIYSQARIIEWLEHLPYSYDEVITYAYNKLDHSSDDIKQLDNIDNIFEILDISSNKTSSQNTDSIRLLVTVLALNNLKSADDKKSRQKIANTLEKWYEITQWIISNGSLSHKNRTILLSMTLELKVYLLKICQASDHLEAIKGEKFLTHLTITIFFLNSKEHSQLLAKIFELILNNVEFVNREQLMELDKENMYKYQKDIQNMLQVLGFSFKFWQNIVQLLLNDKHVREKYIHKPVWIDNLIFSLDFYLSSFEKLNKWIAYVEVHNDILQIEEKLFTVKQNPEFDVVKSLVDLLEKFKNKHSQDITTLWSLVFEALACIDIEKVKEEKILHTLINILFDSSVEIQEVPYLVQTKFRINPRPQFICILMFQALDNSIGTKYEEIVYTLCENWLSILIDRPGNETDSLKDVKVLVTFNNTADIASIFESTSTYLIKYLNCSYFGGVIGASDINFKKASIISKLFFINKAMTEDGEPILEKAFLETKNNPRLKQKLQKGFENIVAWLFLSCGEHTGPIQEYMKAIEEQWKYIIMVVSDTKDSSLIRNVINIYNTLMQCIHSLLEQNKISLALAYSKSKSIHQILESVMEYLMVSDEIADTFVFEQKGLDYFLDLLMSTHESSAEMIPLPEDDTEEMIDTTTTSSTAPLQAKIAGGADATHTVTIEEGKHNSPQEYVFNDEDSLNDELLEYVSQKIKTEFGDVPKQTEEKPEEIPASIGQMSRNVASADFLPNEFARTMTLVDSNIEKVKELVSNMDWSVNKKGYRQRLVFQKYGPDHNNEIWLLFKLNRVIEIKEIQIGFTNFWTVDTEVYIEPSSVIVEAGMTENETNGLCSLQKLDDKGFANFGSTVYGLNLYAFNKQSDSEDLDELIQYNFSSLQSMKARYIKFKIRNNSVTCLENSPLISKYMKPKALGINFISIMGYDVHNVGNINTTILDMKKTTSSKILSIIFKGDFTKTLQKISQSDHYVEHIKSNLNNLFDLLQDKNLSHIICQVLQMFVTYNKDLGDWIISKLLNTNCCSKQVALLCSLSKCNPEHFLARLHIIKDFIFKQFEITSNAENFEVVELRKLEPFMKTFKDLVAIYSKNLQIPSWSQKVFKEFDSSVFENNDLKTQFIEQKRAEAMQVKFVDFTNILTLLNKTEQSSHSSKSVRFNSLMEFTLPVIIYGRVERANNPDEFMTPKEIIELYLTSCSDQKSKFILISSIIANLHSTEDDEIFEIIEQRIYGDDKLSINKNIIAELEKAEEVKEFNETNLTETIEAWINCLNNEEFRSKVSDSETGLKLYDAITKINHKNPTKFSIEIKKLIINLIIKLTIGYQKNETILAKRIIEDLELLKDKKDIEFVNNILTPLLKAENKVPVSFDFLNSEGNTYYTFASAIEQCSESPQNNNFLSRPELAGVMRNFKKVVNPHYNDHKLFISNWKQVGAANGSTNLSDYQNLIDKMHNTPCLFLVVEGFSKNLNDKCIYGVYNRNSVYKKGAEYHIKPSEDNFWFAVHGKDQYASFSMRPEWELIKFDTSDKTKVFNIAQDFIRIPFPNEKSFDQGLITKETCNNIETFGHFSAIQDFKIEKIELWVLDSMDESGKSALPQSASNPIDPIRYLMSLRYEESAALKNYRENWYLLPHNMTLEEMCYEWFQFNTTVISPYAGSTLGEIYKAHRESQWIDNIINLTLKFDEFVDKAAHRVSLGSKTPSNCKKYLPSMGIFDSFEKEGGVTKLISITQKSVEETWKNRELAEKWGLWLQELESFTKLPLFFQLFIKDKNFKDLLFEILAGVPDQETGNSQLWSEKQVEAVKLTYKIIREMFQVSKDNSIREKAAENGLIEKILLRLKEVTGEFERSLVTEGENDEEEVKPPTEEVKEEKEEAQPVKNYQKKKRMGVGYTTGVGKTWNVNQYIKNKKIKNEQIAYLIEILSNFFRTKDWNPPSYIIDNILESCLLPLIENAFRTGSLLDMVKFNKLYISYVRLVRVFSKNKSMAFTLLEIKSNYKPKQIEPIHKLLSKLNDLANIYNSCLQSQTSSDSEKDAEFLIKEIKKTHKSVSKTVDRLQGDQNEAFFENALHLPLRESYPLLLKNLRFDHMDMRNEAGNYVHHYIKNYSTNVSSSKINRLAQELADLSTALPIEHTNGIFVRVDKDRVDLMKAMVMGAVGTPYAHGAFEFDIYWNQNYPKDPPKMNLTTTGAGAVRFNPNLYACGKVCLSLLGTWRGNATENWDPKISTILQVLMSTQAIIMSEEIYFNEPGFEGEAGTPEGEKKNEGYSNIIRYCNIKYAMLEQIKNPPKGFETIIKRHFYLKKDEILSDLHKWIKDAKDNEAVYTGLVSDHNYNWCNKFKVKGAYEKMLKELVEELEQEINKLPEPSGEDLLPAQKKNKKKAQIKQADIGEGAVELDGVDVDSDEEQITTTKNLNVDQDDVKDRWSRYIGAMGIEAVAKQATSNVFFSGASASGIEVSKNVVLAGCKSFTLHDTKKASMTDLSGQFFLHPEDIGKNRATASIKRLQQLNTYVKWLSSTFELPSKEEEMIKLGLDKFQIICLSECSYKTATAINNFCRKKGIKFVYYDVRGPFARIFNDFGDEFIVLDTDGEEVKERWIKEITKCEDGKIQIEVTERHDLADQDKVTITDETAHEIEVISPVTFKIKDKTVLEKYTGNGKITQVKVPVVFKFKSLADCLIQDEIPVDPNLSFADFEKMHLTPIAHACYEALDVFQEENSRLPKPWDLEDLDVFLKNVKLIAERMKQEFDEKWEKGTRLFCFTCSGTLNPLCALIGGFLAQELIKAMTQKYSPTRQMLYFDSTEVCPSFEIDEKLADTIKTFGVQPQGDRYDGIRIVIGTNLLDQIRHSSIFMVGAGAIGCELLKNYAMLGVGSGEEMKGKKKGRIVLTDPDHIETSNLNRQFLFREKHIQKSKSSTAAAAAIMMNNDLKENILARLDKVHDETEYIFNDSFFEGLTAVTNALDNVAARRYIDGRCVLARTPLIEGGTLGPKGNVQVILPFKTESYSSSTDPEDDNQIPHCTLKMFPEESIHCIEWGKDIFISKFNQVPQEVNKIIEDKDFNPQSSQEIASLKQVLKTLESAPKTFEDCLRIAREEFNVYFNYNIKQLLYVYPLDTKTKDGKAFWTAPKRPPHPIEFDPENEMHANFIAASACLNAVINRSSPKIAIPYSESRKMESKLDMAKKAAAFKVKEFVPDESEAKQIKSMVEKEQNDKEQNDEEEEKVEEEHTDVNKLMLDLKQHLKAIIPLVKNGQSYMQVEEFEKDNDINYHVDFISAISNLRCKNYQLKESTWLDVKLKAGRIIPALATTTASVAGMQTLELIKIMKCEKIEEFRNYYLNLALPFIQASEPGNVKKSKIHEDLEVDLWTRWDITNKDITLKELFKYVKDTYSLDVRDVMNGSEAIYMHTIMNIAGKDKQKQQILDSKIIDLTDSEKGDHVDLRITCTKDEDDEKIIDEVPPVRIYFE